MVAGMIETMRTNSPRCRTAMCLALALAGVASGQEDAAKATKAKLESGSSVKSVIKPGEKPLEQEFVLREMLDAFFASVQAGEVDKAYGDLLKGSKIGEKKENVDELVKNTGGVLERFGELVDAELVRAERVGGRVIRLSYLSYGAEFPLQWQFYCYRGTGGWQILDINVNNDLEQIFGAGPEKDGAPGEPRR